MQLEEIASMLGLGLPAARDLLASVENKSVSESSAPERNTLVECAGLSRKLASASKQQH